MIETEKSTPLRIVKTLRRRTRRTETLPRIAAALPRPRARRRLASCSVRPAGQASAVGPCVSARFGGRRRIGRDWWCPPGR